MTKKFKSGDIVRCVNIRNYTGNSIKIGGLYTVVSANRNYVYLTLAQEQAGDGFLHGRFILHDPGLSTEEYEHVLACQEAMEKYQ